MVQLVDETARMLAKEQGALVQSTDAALAERMALFIAELVADRRIKNHANTARSAAVGEVP